MARSPVPMAATSEAMEMALRSVLGFILGFPWLVPLVRTYGSASLAQTLIAALPAFLSCPPHHAPTRWN